MELAIPIFNETFTREGEKTPMYRCCALFDPSYSAEDASLRRATTRLMNRLRKQLGAVGRSWNHQTLARMIFNPQLSGVRLKLGSCSWKRGGCG